MIEKRYYLKVIAYTPFIKCMDKVRETFYYMNPDRYVNVLVDMFRMSQLQHRKYIVQYLNRTQSTIENRLYICQGYNPFGERYISTEDKEYICESLKEWYDEEESKYGVHTYNFISDEFVFTDIRQAMTDRNKSWVYDTPGMHIVIIEHLYDDVTGERVYTCNDFIERTCERMR